MSNQKQVPNRTKVDIDVLIIGAGPVGLFLANECARRGLRWRIVEARPALSVHSKALAIFPRTLEIFDMAGVADPFVEAANRVTALAMMPNGKPLAQLRFRVEQSPYPYIAMVPQNVTESILAEALQRKGGRIEFETAFVSADEKDDRVEITLDHCGTREQVAAAFVVGCDGAHSTVRKSMNLAFAGEQYEMPFMLADVDIRSALPPDELQLCPSELGPLALFPIGDNRRRIVATVDQQEGTAPDLEFVRKLVAQRAPAGVQVEKLHWSSFFRIHHRQVSRLRRGRMFLAGDAAHIHSPFGGQGMNTGLQDVWNLVWKLDLHLQGRGNEMLLDSYTEERIPIIRNVLALTHMMTRVMGTTNKIVQAVRDALVPLVWRLAPFQQAFAERLSQLGTAYSGSPIIVGPGRRYFDDSLRGGNGIRSCFLLVLGDDLAPSMRESARLLCNSSGNLVELRTVSQPGISLVRPDGYIAWSGKTGKGERALDSIRSLMELQTRAA